MKAVIDRFEGEYAVVLFGEDENKVDIPKKLLPEDVREGSWLNVSFELDIERGKNQRHKMQRKLDNLKNKKQ